MKKIFKTLLVRVLGYQVRRLFSKNNVTVVGVVGSAGKTSTKYAIASVLSREKRVQWQKGNYNDILTVALVIFGHDTPNIYSPLAWTMIFNQNRKIIKKGYDYDVVVLELGTDGPGQIKEFSAYLNLDIALVTSIAPEHMEFFETLDQVADEELSVKYFSKKLIINGDLIDEEFTKGLQAVSFGLESKDVAIIIGKTNFKIMLNGKLWIQAPLQDGAVTQAYSLTAAALVAKEIGIDNTSILEGLKQIETPPGRMQLLQGINNSTIIDDTYNASPEAVKTALDYLYDTKAKQKIALLGNMNELGHYSKEAHIAVGEYCDSAKLDLVITVGPDANRFLAASAAEKGCRVKSFSNPYEAGEFVKTIIEPGAFVLAKGSQNNVYMEEAIKLLLADQKDAKQLVRQSDAWLAKKRKNFPR